ncbi:MAG: SDR family oxidoreductase [Leptospiraceae bacterium]
MDAPANIFRKDLLKGKVAIVTGGSSGIGNGIARRLAMAGADVVIASRRKERCEEEAKKLTDEFGIKSIGLPLNVVESSDVNRMFAEAADQMGKIDILINNAAGNFYFPAHKLRDKLWHAVIDIDLNGTFYCARAAHKYMKDNGGVIISISMTLHHNGWVGMAPATAAKSGIDALTKTLALEWAHKGIRVNAIAPGPIITEGVSKAFEMGGSFDQFQSTIPLGRSGHPEEIGNLAVFMASDAGNWMTGSIYIMDGGEALSPHRGAVDPTKIDDLLKQRVKKGKE